MSNELLNQQLQEKYKLGFSLDMETDEFPKGLDESIITKISQIKKEPQWLLNWRLQAFAHWKTLTEPQWANVKHPAIDYQDITYYSSPKEFGEKKELTPELIEYYNKLGVPLGEREILAGNIAVDAVLDSVSVGTTFKAKLQEVGVIFCSFSEAVENHPELIKEYLGTVVNYKDNYFAALNSAVFSDGSFCYIPKGVKCPMELSTYFRINKANIGQFERTLIIAEDDSYVSYLEGCFLAGSLISTPNGPSKIEDIKVGDFVYDHFGKSQKVKNLMIRNYSGKIFSIDYGGDILNPTEEHPFLSIKGELLTQKHLKNKSIDLNGNWVNCCDLKRGDFLYIPIIDKNNEPLNHLDLFKAIDEKGYWVQIKDISFEHMETIVYNFEVENTNTYLVNGIAVHNCSAPARSENQLHAAVVELVAKDNAHIRYSTVQNWYPGDENGTGGVYNFVTKRGDARGYKSHISWTQIETGSAITWKYPSVILRGDGSSGEFYSVALTNHHQQADTGTKMIHIGKNTKSTIISKSISAGQSTGTYRGLVRMAKIADNARNFTQCDSLIFGQAKVNTQPYIENSNYKSVCEHEATTSKIAEDHLFYLMQRGISDEQAKNMLVNGFCKSIFQKLPAEFAVEAQRLLEINLEGSMG